ncbi:uncharacterized, partial [Tachysurus ichikawai]
THYEVRTSPPSSHYKEGNDLGIQLCRRMPCFTPPSTALKAQLTLINFVISSCKSRAEVEQERGELREVKRILLTSQPIARQSSSLGTETDGGLTEVALTPKLLCFASCNENSTLEQKI